MLSKKDFKAIAGCVNAAFKPIVNPQYQTFERGINVGCQEIAHRLIEYLESNNSRFNRQKFIDTCFKN